MSYALCISCIYFNLFFFYSLDACTVVFSLETVFSFLCEIFTCLPFEEKFNILGNTLRLHHECEKRIDTILFFVQ